MNFLLVVISSVSLLHAIDCYQYSTIDPDFTLDGLQYFSSKRNEFEERATDNAKTDKPTCVIFYEIFTSIVNDELDLPSELMRLLPTLNEKKINRRETFEDGCPPEYLEWAMKLASFSKVLTEDQAHFLGFKISLALEKMEKGTK